MQYLNELPQISSISIDGGVIELELEQEVEELPDLGDEEPVVLTANFANQVVITVGKVIELKTIEGPDVWTRIKIKGSSVSFTL